MTKYKIGILNGDDIGLEIVPVAVKVLKTAVAQYPDIDVEWHPLPEKLQRRCPSGTISRN